MLGRVLFCSENPSQYKNLNFRFEKHGSNRENFSFSHRKWQFVMELLKLSKTKNHHRFYIDFCALPLFFFFFSVNVTPRLAELVLFERKLP